LIQTAVIGAAGYAGVELVRWLCGHPQFECVLATSDGDAGVRLDGLYPALRGRCQLAFEPHEAVFAADGLQLAFLAVPHTAAMALAPRLLAAGVAVVDLSADFRLSDAAVFEQWYAAAHTAPELLDQAVYGLVEVERAALAASAAGQAAGRPALVANPGCYPTASILAVYPALAAGLVADVPLVINAISGVSGAGRKATATTHFCHADASLKAYGATTHRHTPEIEQELARIAGRLQPVVFTPHLAPLVRGMVSTVVLPLAEGADVQQCLAAYEQAYAAEPFVQFLGFGAMPDSASVSGGNHAHVGIAFDARTNSLVASCAIDNLGKGAAAQAIQCANIVFGYPEACGLDAIGRIL